MAPFVVGRSAAGGRAQQLAADNTAFGHTAYNLGTQLQSANAVPCSVLGL
jgi:hypothetical protein